MLKSFFVAYNGSGAARAALEQCCFLASLTHGRIHLGNIIELSYEPAIATGMGGRIARIHHGGPADPGD